MAVTSCFLSHFLILADGGRNKYYIGLDCYSNPNQCNASVTDCITLKSEIKMCYARIHLKLEKSVLLLRDLLWTIALRLGECYVYEKQTIYLLY